MEALKSLLSYLNSLTWTREQVIMNLVFLAVFAALVWLFIRGLLVVLKVKSLVAELQTTKTQAAESGKLVQQLCQERTTLHDALQARVAQLEARRDLVGELELGLAAAAAKSIDALPAPLQGQIAVKLNEFLAQEIERQFQDGDSKVAALVRETLVAVFGSRQQALPTKLAARIDELVDNALLEDAGRALAEHVVSSGKHDLTGLSEIVIHSATGALRAAVVPSEGPLHQALVALVVDYLQSEGARIIASAKRQIDPLLLQSATELCGEGGGAIDPAIAGAVRTNTLAYAEQSLPELLKADGDGVNTALVQAALPLFGDKRTRQLIDPELLARTKAGLLAYVVKQSEAVLIAAADQIDPIILGLALRSLGAEEGAKAEKAVIDEVILSTVAYVGENSLNLFQTRGEKLRVALLAAAVRLFGSDLEPANAELDPILLAAAKRYLEESDLTKLFDGDEQLGDAILDQIERIIRAAGKDPSHPLRQALVEAAIERIAPERTADDSEEDEDEDEDDEDQDEERDDDDEYSDDDDDEDDEEDEDDDRS